jgi:hypothetical protein
MSLRTQICVLAIAAGVVALSVSRPAAAAMQPPASLQALVGNWACAYTGPKGTTKSTYSIARAGDLWVQGSGHIDASPGSPAHTSFFIIGYDPKKHLFVNMGASTMAGDYGISTAPGAASAMTMTYVNNYPADATHEKDVWSYNSTGLTIASTWTEKGKPMSAKGTCTKS